MIATPVTDPWTGRYRNHRVLTVLSARNVTPQLRRVTLGGPEFAGIPDGSVIKLIIPPPGVRGNCWPLKGARGEALWPPDGLRPAVRTYTARRLDRVRGELDVDFVLHGSAGVAASWAERAAPGDPIGIGGPGGLVVKPADWYLFAGDHTALPAIARSLEELPRDARGQAFIEVPDATEEMPLEAPAGVAVTWLHRNGTPPGRSDALIDAVATVRWPEQGLPFVWVGTESRTALALKSFVRDDRKIDRRRFLIIGYWKRGMAETDYSEAHDHDRGEDYHAVAGEHQGEAAPHHHDDDHHVDG